MENQVGMNTVDPEEIAKFEAMAAQWWDVDGEFRPLHRMNPIRLEYICEHITAHYGRDSHKRQALEGVRVLDVGCGGGLLCEPLARLGARMTGVDAAEGALSVARLHAQQSELEIEYYHGTAESLAAREKQFDVVLAWEIIEHVAAPQAFLESCASLIAPGGMFIGSTLNRTVKSYGLAILGAEYLLRWLPIGTHDWHKFVTPDEFTAMIEKTGLNMVDQAGFVYHPVRDVWRCDRQDMAVNYALTAIKPV